MSGKSTGKKCEKSVPAQIGSTRSPTESRDIGVQVGIQSNLSDKATAAALAKESKEMFPKISIAKSEVYLFMRCKKEFAQRLKNAFIRDKRVVANTGGRYIGISEDIKRCEGELYTGKAEKCLIIMEFCDMNHAERWMDSSTVFKQKDFPSPSDMVEIFVMPLSYLPNEELTAYQLVEMYGLVVEPAQFQDKYVNPVTKLMNARRIYHGVVASHTINRLRNCMIRPDTFVLLNCAESESKLTDFYDSVEYAPYREYRQKAVAETDSCIFSLQSMATF